MKPQSLCIALLLPVFGLALFAPQDPQRQDPTPSQIPRGLPREIPGLDGSEQSRLLARLGQRLFADKNLSVDRSTACISCHPPAHGFAFPGRRPSGAYGRQPPRSVPTLLNRALGQSFGWLGNVPSLDELVLLPFDDENEFDLPVEAALERIEADAEYVALFERISGEGPDRETLRRALVSYVRTILTGDSPVDRFHDDVNSLTTAERQGKWIYESKGGCWRCHSGFGNFTDEKFHNTGVGAVDGVPEEGRFAFTGDEKDRGRFKTPTLRGLTMTAPYMHDGSIATLEEVVAFYRGGGNANANLDRRIKPLSLTDEEAANLVAFLRALSRR